MNDDFRNICEVKYRYALGIDTRDWDLYRSIFTNEVVMDFSSYSGQQKTRMRADAWVSGCKALFEGLDATQHVMTNPIVEIEAQRQPRRARLKMYMKAEHFLLNELGDASFTLGGYYDDELVETEAGWKLSSVTLTVLWSRGNRHIMALATADTASDA